MIDKITKILTKKTVNNVKEVAKEEIDNYLPIILGLISGSLVLLSIFKNNNERVIEKSKIVINNYNIYIGGNK